MIRNVLGVALVALAAASIYMSWGALYEFAIATGMPPERAIVFPAVIDVVTVVAMLVALLVEAPSRSVAAYPWIALVIFGAATIAGNAMHVATAPADTIRVDLWVAVVANALPAIALLITTHLAAVTVYRRKPAPRSAWLDALSAEPFDDEVYDPIREQLREDIEQLAAATATPPHYVDDLSRPATEEETARLRAMLPDSATEEEKRGQFRVLLADSSDEVQQAETDADDRARVAQLHGEKKSIRTISFETGVPRSTVQRWVKQLAEQGTTA